MKKVILVIIVLAAIAPAMAQVTDIAQIEAQLTERPWLDKSVHEIYGHRIVKVFGERPSACTCDSVSGFGAPSNEALGGRDVSHLFQREEVLPQGPVAGSQTLLDCCEIKWAIRLQSRQDTQPKGSMDDAVKTGEVNRRHGSCGSGSIAMPEPTPWRDQRLSGYRQEERQLTPETQGWPAHRGSLAQTGQ